MSSTPDGSEFTTQFTRIAKTGYVDMRLDIVNPTEEPVTMVGRLVALDASGEVLPKVRVTTAFGSEAGRAVLMPGENVDFVQLDGEGEQQVREIELDSPRVSVLDIALETQDVELKSLDGKGRILDYDMLAEHVRLENPSPVAVRVRIVLMVLIAPKAGVPQEAELVHDVATVEVPAAGSKVVDLPENTRRILREYGLTSYVTLRPVLAPGAEI